MINTFVVVFFVVNIVITIHFISVVYSHYKNYGKDGTDDEKISLQAEV